MNTFLFGVNFNKILAFLSLFNCYPDGAVITPSNATFFLAGPDVGVIYIRPDMYKEHILVHELYHWCSWDWANRQSAKTWEEWRQREIDAIRITNIYLEQDK